MEPKWIDCGSDENMEGDEMREWVENEVKSDKLQGEARWMGTGEGE